jgi:hypothetical protein
MSTEELTRKANHPVLLRDRANSLRRIRGLSMAPCIRMLRRDPAEFGVHLRRLLIVVRDGLIPVGPKPVLIQRIHMDRGADGMDASDVVWICEYGLFRLEKNPPFVSFRFVGENTEPTVSDGSVQSGGICLFLTHELTVKRQ